MKYIDLHVHSTFSDGTLTPAELAVCAAEKKLAAFALTDHDTTEGIEEAEKAAAGLGVELIPGIELSAEYQGKDIHILGLGIHPEQTDFARLLKSFQESREARNEEIAERLRLKGIDVTLPLLRKTYKSQVITRAHFGRWLFETHQVESVSQAFALYIGEGCPCFVPKKLTSPDEAIKGILAAGGIPILAHPLLYHLTEQGLQTLLRVLKEQGLKGLEAIHSSNMGNDEQRLRRLAREMGLKISGGSDYHGKNKPLLQMGSGKGNLKIPYHIWEDLHREETSLP
ncbi:MAG: PHP domain-containing protein [Lachnospiraceae bacterium]|jgi:predicted metal-dependent phosphoesterase TrpH|nr:PHP domain-containing protein [Lachnospiraceae bacterium]